MVTIPRNRNAMIAAGIVMFGQQFCGVNVIGVWSLEFFDTAKVLNYSDGQQLIIRPPYSSKPVFLKYRRSCLHLVLV